MKPNLNALRMFDAAGRHLNFRLAAQELHLTQGAVAQQVRRLEADLGLALFERRARGLAFTDAGRRYHAPVRRALAMIDEATRSLRPGETRVTLSVTPSIASKWLVSRLSEFSRLHPEVEVQTVASERLSNFQSDGVDVAIRQGCPPFGEGLRVALLAPLELCAVCSPEHAKTIPPITKLEDFTGQRLVQDAHHHWETLFQAAGVGASRPIGRFNQTALAMDAAASGQGIALAPRLLMDTDLEQGRLVVLWRERRPGATGFYVIWPQRVKTIAGVDALVEWLLTTRERAAAPGT